MSQIGDESPAGSPGEATSADAAAPPSRRPGRAQIAVRSAIFHAVFYTHLVAVLVLFTPVYFLLSQPQCLAVVRGLATRSLWLLRVVCGTGVEFRGLENLPKVPFVLAHKHQSMWEIFAIAAVIRSPVWVIKSELLLIPVVGWWARKAGMIFVRRGTRSAAIAQLTEGCVRAFAKGRTVVLAPEGTRRRLGAPPAYKYGVAHLHQTFDVPIVPTALNSGFYWPWWGFLRYPGTVVVSFRPAIRGRTAPDAC
jgi:1-acyl-sn-glycerol-3-phosphate acyltransferase